VGGGAKEPQLLGIRRDVRFFKLTPKRREKGVKKKQSPAKRRMKRLFCAVKKNKKGESPKTACSPDLGNGEKI